VVQQTRQQSLWFLEHSRDSTRPAVVVSAKTLNTKLNAERAVSGKLLLGFGGGSISVNHFWILAAVPFL
jgi:hypothetical protein